MAILRFFACYCRVLQENVAKCGKKLNFKKAGSEPIFSLSNCLIDESSVRIDAGDHAGIQRLVEYISRCPFSLARMVAINADGRIAHLKGEVLPVPANSIF
jgi:hypothetical protein